MHSRSCTAHCPRAVGQCIAGGPLPTAIDGAAWHVGCSGPMRPCVTAHRCRQGSVGQVRECTGPAMQQHTCTQRAHNTHSPARLPLPLGRHPGLLPFGNSAFGTPHHTTRHHTTPHHTTPHHTTPHHTTPHHTTPHHTTPHHTTPHHATPHYTTPHHRRPGGQGAGLAALGGTLAAGVALPTPPRQ